MMAGDTVNRYSVYGVDVSSPWPFEFPPLTDAANPIARVEFVKGPAAPLYGLAYPGGVMNNITKSVNFEHNFASLRGTVGNFSDWRVSMDANVSASTSAGGDRHARGGFPGDGH